MSTVEYAVALPFRLGISGAVESTVDQTQIWSDRVLTVIGTAISERVHRYYFGSRVHQEVFMTEGEAAIGVVDEIGKAFANFLPLLTLISVDTDFDISNATLNVRVNYRLPNNDLQTTQIGSVSLNGNSPPQEV
jgi:phage baseplate assembly protein W